MASSHVSIVIKNSCASSQNCIQSSNGGLCRRGATNSPPATIPSNLCLIIASHGIVPSTTCASNSFSISTHSFNFTADHAPAQFPFPFFICCRVITIVWFRSVTLVSVKYVSIDHNQLSISARSPS